MKKSLLILSMFSAATFAGTTNPELYITGIYEGSNGNTDLPKFVEILVTNMNGNADLSMCTIELWTNGVAMAPIAPVYTFPAAPAPANDDVIYVAGDAAKFDAHFVTEGKTAGYEYPSFTGSMSGGNDAVLIKCNGSLVDQYGDPSGDATAQGWLYNDSFATRIQIVGTPPVRALGSFNVAQWSVGATNDLDACGFTGTGSINSACPAQAVYGPSTLPVELSNFSVE